MTSSKTPPQQPGAQQPEPPLEMERSEVTGDGEHSEHEPTTDQPSETAQHTFPIVGIGASAGGLAAYEAFFSGLPSDRQTGMAFVLVQHLSPDHKSILGEIVSRYVKMKVREVEDGMEVEPNHTYIIPPNKDMSLEGGRLRLVPPNEPRGQRLPIDYFFRSLAREQRERAICVVLSGTGSDGTLGVRAIKGEGGMAMAQEPSTTEHDGMPRSAIATGMIDYVLAPADMPVQLITYAHHAYDKEAAVSRPAPSDEGILKRLTALLRAQTGHDFSQYKSTTLLRRMERRMALHQIVEHEEYFKFAREKPAEVEGLFRDLLIGVTNFFRDPEAFKVLEQTVIPRLFKSKASHDQLRVWVCACSTGEEAYSIAILLQEQLEASKRAVKMQVFATDLDHLAIEQARAGVYPASIAADVTPERLTRFFVQDRERDVYRVQKVIRDMLVFSEQDVIRDPPFSKLDLITCRNLLIYLNGAVQRKLIPMFHYALNPGGSLLLGSSETVGEFTRLFSPVDRKMKVYNRENVEPEARLGVREYAPTLRDGRSRHRPLPGTPVADPAIGWKQLAEHTLLSHYAEAGILVNGRGDILYIHGRTGKYLEPASGDAALNILAMAREGLRRELTTALHKVAAHKKPANYKSLRVKENGGYVTIDLTIMPVEVAQGASKDLYLVVIEETPEPEDGATTTVFVENADYSGRVAELEHELKAKEDYLQTTLEEMETANEELKSTNEEMQSVNEELQSTNEELETSKEELQSVNEELSTVNAELQDKVADLSRLNNDMNNLLAGTGVGTVFVDNSLRILRFTPTATQIINLIPGDLGRPVEHIVSNLVGYGDLMEDLRQVLDTLIPKEAEVCTKSGAWYLMRIRPYRTIDNSIEGAVLTFVDVSERKRIADKLRDSEARFQAIFNQAFAGVAQVGFSGEFSMVNDRFCEMLGYSREELLSGRIQQLTHPDDVARSVVLLGSLAAGGPDFTVEKRYQRRDGTSIWVADRVSGIRDEKGRVTSAVVISFDISDRREMESDAALGDVGVTSELDALSRLDGVRSLSISATNKEVVFGEMLDAAIAINQADMGTMQLCSGDGARLVIVADRGFDKPYIDFWNQAAERQGSCGKALELVEQVTVEDVTKSPLFVGTPSFEVQMKAGVRAVQSTPMVTRAGKRVGVLSTHYRVPYHQDARRSRVFDLLAREIAEIIDHGIQSRGPTD